ncbi:S1 RNA-binding domain-containing protein [Candidatus Falkowbacteria bacterium]|nr:S1 RNA-binding domain-containing protein [Candidatus Falkowbacteria bacterium]
MKATTIKSDKKSKEMEKLLAMEKTKPVPKIGDLITGKIISVGKNEVLLDIDGLTTGVVRGYERYDESGEYSNLTISDEVSATVIDLENEKGQIELSFRHAGHIKAWEKLKNLLDEEIIVEVEVTDANKGGLMVKLGNIAGFLPVSQLTPEHYPRVEGGNKNKILEKLRSFAGKKIRVKVIAAEEEEEKLIVSEKETLKEEQEKVISKYKVGDTVEGKVSGVVDFGAFIEFDDGLEGLVHISELAWQRIDDPRDVIKVGEKVKAEIIDIDNSKISLSIKKLLVDPWKEVVKKYKLGQIVEGTVLKINPFGLFVQLDDAIHGLAHISELATRPISNVSEVAKIGDKLKFKVISVEPEDHRLGLSIKAMGEGKGKMMESGEDNEKSKVKSQKPKVESKVKSNEDDNVGSEVDKKKGADK